MTVREETDPIKLRAQHVIAWTMGAARWSITADSTQRAYLVESDGGFRMHLSGGGSHVHASTAACETFITAELSATIP